MHSGLNRINRGFGSVVLPMVPLPEAPRREIPNIPINVQPQTAAKPERAVSLSGIVLSRLTDLKPASDELKARLAETISEAASVLAQCDALVVDCETERRSNLEARHDEIRAQGRKQLALIKKLEKDEGEALRFWNQAREAKQQREADLQQAIENERGLGPWVSKREEADAKIAVASAKESLKAAIQREAEVLFTYNSAAIGRVFRR